MNIFFLHSKPNIAARMQCDQHTVKMPIECTQMMSDTHHVLSENPPEGICDLYNPNHGCTKWVRESASNYMWLYRLFIALCEEYEYRYGREHESMIRAKVLANPPPEIPHIGFTAPYLAMPDEFKLDGTVKSYRNFYLHDKLFARWTRRPPPKWWHHQTTYPDKLRQKRLRERPKYLKRVRNDHFKKNVS